MSVQAQYPSNVLVSDLRKRARPEAWDGMVHDLSLQDGDLQLHSAGVNFLPQPAVNAGMFAENGIHRSSVCVRKKPREETILTSKHQTLVAPFNPVDGDRYGFMTTVCNDRIAELNLSQQAAWVYSSGMPAVDTARLALTGCTSMSGRGINANTGVRSLLDDSTIHPNYYQQQAEIDQIITHHNEQLKQALEEKRRQHTRALLELIDHSELSCARERLVEIEKIRHRNVELEDYVKKLSLESQVWMNIAQSQEALVTSLRSNLEQVVAQSNEKAKGRFGESDAEDAESCIYGASLAVNAVDLQAQEIRELKEQRSCRNCKKESISVLILPCRHLCLCTDCDPTIGNCPVCGTSKDASVRVYMD
ncbi:hypothetical protein GOP47_0002379 [Adiantum capillus-veneris]|uniref:RING-type domain-containing protein n=1 Tax=Adiantum capillus-veneris TaxID=13818 RepID=A0A9D4V9S3_ADICA|nr:hypothetical protein GOP47_0002001 [Adiantum capillus-veneris]KAI5082636.1 hypothetical protein GOP47_0002379 [Adiantum capillus-veneris]